MKKIINDIPTIKMFIINNHFYVYDTYKNQILNVTKEQYQEIYDLTKKGVSEYLKSKKTSDAYRNIVLLIHKGYFKCNFVKEVIHVDTKYIPDLVTRCINDLTLQVTQDCNFKCRYCLFTRDNKIDRTHHKKEMSWDIAKKSVDFFFQNSKDIDDVNISFYGGEPLLNYKLICDVVNYANAKFQTKKVTYHMTTNGSILNPKIIDLLVDNQFHLMISLDGPPDIQNFHRKFYENGKGTYDTVEENILKLRDYNEDYFNNFVSFNPVILPDEDKNKVMKFFADKGINGDIHCTAANLNGIDYIKSETQVKKYIDNEYYFDSDEQIILENAFANKDKIPEKWHHNGPCIPSISRLFVDVNGNFYPCEKIVELPYCTIGDLDNGINLSKVANFLNIGKLTEDSCKKCWAMRFCEICVSTCIDVDTGGLSIVQKNHMCEQSKERAEKFIRKICLNKQDKMI